MFVMTSKNFQVNHQNWWLNIEVVGVGGPVTRPLESAIRAVNPVTGLPTITVGAVSPATRSPTPVDNMASLVTNLWHKL